MAYEFKKLSEVEKLDSVPDGASVLAEVNGVIRRVPGSGLGGSGGVSSWNDLTDKPFGEEVSALFAEQTLEFAPDDEFNGLYATSTTASAMLMLEETYTVVWDGKSYSCVAQDASSILGEGFIAIGNGSAFGLSGDNEPFAIATSLLEDPGEVFVIAAFLAIDGSTSTSHTVSIYQNRTKYLDNKYLEFVKTENTSEVVPNQVIKMELDPDGIFKYSVEQDTELYMQLYHGINVGETYNVLWNGRTYTCVAEGMTDEELSGFSEVAKAAFLRSGPFQIGVVDAVTTSGNKMIGAIIYMEDPNITESYCDVSFGISSFGTDTIKPEYIPGPPYFDLTAMGLPAIPLDGTTVSVECDTTEFRAAAAKGLIKAKFDISVPGVGTLEYENICSMGYLIATATYTYVGIMLADGAFVINCNVNADGIYCFATPLAPAT